jgi:hypothetical protein
MPSVAASPPVEAHIDKNPVKPGVKGGVPAKTVQVLESPQKSLLGEVFRILNVPVCEGVGDGIGFLLIPVNQLLDGRLVALASPDDKIFVFQG